MSYFLRLFYSTLLMLAFHTSAYSAGHDTRTGVFSISGPGRQLELPSDVTLKIMSQLPYMATQRLRLVNKKSKTEADAIAKRLVTGTVFEGLNNSKILDLVRGMDYKAIERVFNNPIISDGNLSSGSRQQILVKHFFCINKARELLKETYELTSHIDREAYLRGIEFLYCAKMFLLEAGADSDMPLYRKVATTYAENFQPTISSWSCPYRTGHLELALKL